MFSNWTQNAVVQETDKAEIIQRYLPPKNIKELWRILELFNWFRKFIRNFSTVASPIVKLLKKGIYSNITF